MLLYQTYTKLFILHIKTMTSIGRIFIPLEKGPQKLDRECDTGGRWEREKEFCGIGTLSVLSRSEVTRKN